MLDEKSLAILEGTVLKWEHIWWVVGQYHGLCGEHEEPVALLWVRELKLQIDGEP